MARIARALGVRITDVDEFRDEALPPPRERREREREEG
jgi:hypothetical protein